MPLHLPGVSPTDLYTVPGGASTGQPGRIHNHGALSTELSTGVDEPSLTEPDRGT